MDQLKVQGKKIDIKVVKSELSMSKFINAPGFRRVYCITPPFGMRESTIKVQIVKKKVIKNKKIRKSQQKKRERLQEILNAPIEIKRPPQRARIKNPLPVNTKVYPDYKIQTQIYSNRKKSLEQLRQSFFKENINKGNEEDMFDLSVLLPFITTTYNRLYEQDLELLKGLVDENEKPPPIITKLPEEYTEIVAYSDNEEDELGDDDDDFDDI